MAKKHRKWYTIIAYCTSIPIDSSIVDFISHKLKHGKNILIMIKKEDSELNPKFTQKEKFDELCKLFPEETKTGRIILSAVPDIVDIKTFDY